MNNRDPHIVNSLRRWIQGDVTQKQESQLEQDAHEDLFLQEALEGYRQFPDGRHEERLQRMRQQLQTRAGKKRGGLLITMPYRIAAAAAVVLAVGLFWLITPRGSSSALSEAEHLENNDPEEAAAATENIPVDELRSARSADSPATIPAETLAADQLPTGRDLSAAAPKALATEAKSSEKELQAANEAEDEPEQSKPSAFSEEVTRATSQTATASKRESTAADPIPGSQNIVARTEPVSPSAPPPPLPSNSADDFAIGGVKLNQTGGSRLISGQVFDRSGTPLNGVLVVSPGDRTGTITNINGQYQIRLDSNVQKLEFQRSGYNFQRVDIPDSGGIVRVTLDENANTVDKLLAEEESAKKRKRNKPSPSVSGITAQGNIAQPVVGFKRFENYLNLNLRYPEQALEKGISGEVVLSFTIMPDGMPANVRAVDGPGYGLEQEAVRLLQRGAKWEIINGGRESVDFIYRMKFAF